MPFVRSRACDLHSGPGLYLQQFRFNGGHSILNPFANLGVSVLAYMIVVFPRAEERGRGVDVALIENCVDCDSEEIAEGGGDGLVSVEDGGSAV